MPPPPPPATIREIAKALNCSHMTVSRALRGTPGVGKEKARAICEFAEKMGYTPNPLVSALMQTRKHHRPPQQTSNLAFVHYFPTSLLVDESVQELYKGARQRAQTLGYAIEIIWGAEPELGRERLTQMLKARGINGVVFAPMPLGCRTVDFDWDQFAIASMGFTLRKPKIHRVGTYQYHSIPLAYRELVKLGYHSIGICITDRGSRRVDRAWEASLAMLKYESGPEAVHLLPETIESKETFAQWLAEHRIDALINAGHHTLHDFFPELGIRVPEDLGYVSFHAKDTATVRRDWVGIGAEAVNLVDSQLMHNERGIPAKPKTVLVEGEWDPADTVRTIRPERSV
ncbi:LacI family DNA-binding transcriptional regulator [Coraliomargarita parva]|uniref:LacI family DNA-binding transcriptional regulator n=1 Tax=Coraliomargarita parva TaxID=3014050 RepID=UPI0022B318DA|nr:LacI family DNA-binding transcriptional regulator [Coraliomargarita parva]